MIQFILYFLSRFSVKIKVAFLIVFLISGVLFWNISYLNDTIKQNEKTQKLLFAFEAAQKINTILFSLQKERTYSIAFAEHAQNKDELERVREESDGYLSMFSSCKENLKSICFGQQCGKIIRLQSDIIIDKGANARTTQSVFHT